MPEPESYQPLPAYNRHVVLIHPASRLLSRFLRSGEFTTFDFVPGIPAPFNFGLAILLNQKMLTLGEKLQTAPPLLPMLVQGQDFIDAQDELSVLDFMRKYGMPERINTEVFISMAKVPSPFCSTLPVLLSSHLLSPPLTSPPLTSSHRLSPPLTSSPLTSSHLLSPPLTSPSPPPPPQALDFIDPDKLSMTVVLTAMNRFLNEDDGLQMAFLDGNQVSPSPSQPAKA